MYVLVCVFKVFSETTGPTEANFYVEPQWDKVGKFILCRALEIEKLKAPLFRGPEGAGETNDWCINGEPVYSYRVKETSLGGVAIYRICSYFLSCCSLVTSFSRQLYKISLFHLAHYCRAISADQPLNSFLLAILRFVICSLNITAFFLGLVFNPNLVEVFI